MTFDYKYHFENRFDTELRECELHVQDSVDISYKDAKHIAKTLMEFYGKPYKLVPPHGRFEDRSKVKIRLYVVHNPLLKVHIVRYPGEKDVKHILLHVSVAHRQGVGDIFSYDFYDVCPGNTIMRKMHRKYDIFRFVDYPDERFIATRPLIKDIKDKIRFLEAGLVRDHTSRRLKPMSDETRLWAQSQLDQMADVTTRIHFEGGYARYIRDLFDK